MRTSETTAELYKALAAAQAELTDPAASAENDHFKSKYAKLSDGTGIIRPVLASHGLSYSQGLQYRAPELGGLTMVTRIAHASGEWMETDYPVTSDPKNPQRQASANTYARRHALFGAVGIAPSPSDNDDGERASGRGGKAAEDAFNEGSRAGRAWAIKQILAKARDGYHGAGAAKALKDAGVDHSLEHVKLWCLWLGKDKPSRMQAAQLDAAIKFLSSPKGAESWETFAAECGPIPKQKKRVPKWFREALEGMDWKVDEVRAWCGSEGWGDPVSWPKQKQEGLMEALKGGEKAQALAAWLEARQGGE